VPLVPPYIASLQPYVTGRSIEDVRRETGLDRIVKLASNENPLGPSPRAVEAIARAARDCHRYPDGGVRLREALSRKFGVPVKNITVGSGSEGIMQTIVRTFLLDGDEVLTSAGTFTGIRVLSEGRGVRFRTVPLDGWRFDLPALAEAISDRTKIVYLANPNNPTGTMFTRAEFDDFYARVPERVLIILDEAYFEYAAARPDYPDSLHYRYDNAITLRTFSKVHGLAGVRLGYGFAHESLISYLERVRLPFEPSSLAVAAGIAAIEDEEFVARSVAVNARERRRLTRELSLLGYPPVASEANFLLIPDAAWLAPELLKRGVIVRPMNSFGLPECVRITVGAPEENEVLLECLSQILISQSQLQPA
jgi:histidinol-phosphate aminotransferase